MSRLARQLSETGIYHIVFRGLNKQNIFEDVSDFRKMRDTLLSLKKEMNFEIYAYCLMSNHVHILLKEINQGDISLIMKRLLTKYARWYNIKYDRSGALIANRYKSKPVDVDEYFLPVIRYIHQNPVKAGLVKDMSDYTWSSFGEYLFECEGLADTEFVFDMIDRNEFVELHNKEDDSIYLVDDKIKLTDDEIRRRILKQYSVRTEDISMMPKKERDRLLQNLRSEYSIRELMRITGLTRGIIQKKR